MSEFKYTDREQVLVDIYTQKIETLEEKIKDLELIIKHNKDLDDRKLHDIYRTSKGIKTYQFNEKTPLSK